VSVTRRMTARSVVLSVLLGAHPARATAAELVRLTAGFDIKESTLRVALTRMVAGGDLVRAPDGYRLSERLLARQRRQDLALRPEVLDWNGDWLTVVVTAVGAGPRARGELRTAMHNSRFGELREGVWLRPDNLGDCVPDQVTDRVRVLRARDGRPGELARRLWDLPEWSAAGELLLAEMSAAQDVPARFECAAAMVRLLLTDPVLPAELLPADWPGERLREAYTDFAGHLAARGQLTEAR
jgi:phenylacetic acid degradation operon negative regulatory protein